MVSRLPSGAEIGLIFHQGQPTRLLLDRKEWSAWKHAALTDFNTHHLAFSLNKNEIIDILRGRLAVKLVIGHHQPDIPPKRLIRAYTLANNLAKKYAPEPATIWYGMAA